MIEKETSRKSENERMFWKKRQTVFQLSNPGDWLVNIG